MSFKIVVTQRRQTDNAAQNLDSERRHDGASDNEERREEEDIMPSSLVATFVPEYRDEIPQIGRVLTVEEEVVTIEWLQGTYSSLWKVCKRREGRNVVPWVEDIPKTAIISKVELTKGQRLPGAVKTKLKSLYANLL